MIDNLVQPVPKLFVENPENINTRSFYEKYFSYFLFPVFVHVIYSFIYYFFLFVESYIW